ncbi:hypothetical protein ACIPSA_04900 [Streptomyces sp. NPDC086549]|uniref:hypothetical protein n=1 Tax=Streptomyces sp. NPDC086549 TaxID=3365752 RepID=UPI003829FFB4
MAVIVGAGSLLLTSVATYFQARVSQDQLQQSQEDSARERLSQASRVTYWTEDYFARDSRWHFMNRTPDPISNIKVELNVNEGAEEGWQSLPLILPSLPPCTEMIIKEEALKWPRNGLGRIRDVKDSALVVVVRMRFSDRAGVGWLREESTLTPLPDGAVLDRDGDGEVEIHSANSQTVQGISAKPASTCEDTAK